MLYIRYDIFSFILALYVVKWMLVDLLFVWSIDELQNYTIFFCTTYFLYLFVFLKVNNAGQMLGITHMIQGTPQNLSPFGISQVLVCRECHGTKFSVVLIVWTL